MSELASLEELFLIGNSITDVSPLSGLTSLTTLHLEENSINDLGALSGLTSLDELFLNDNSINDISPLSGLTSLTILALNNNFGLTDTQPLMDNTGLGPGDIVNLFNTNVNCADVAALEARGMMVFDSC